MGYNADAAKAVLAITNACNQVTSCTPGQTGHGRRRVSGTFVAPEDPKEEIKDSPDFHPKYELYGSRRRCALEN